MRTRPSSAFTLIELITAMAVILILTGLVIQIAGYVTTKASKARAETEIATFKAACESYKADVGGYPQDLSNGLATPGVTDELKPKEHFIPTQKVYEKANVFLYKELTGDKIGQGNDPDGVPEADEPRYLKEFDPKLLKVERDVSTNKVTRVLYIQDPFGYPYGYSTAAAREEMLYLQELKAKGTKAHRVSSDQVPGFNGSTFDLWSTGGSRPSTQPTDLKKKELEWAKWVKNW
jgi:prepilin-type N-terminal cleavage/methylation domain-containing protein